jgi:hypothetical protein
MCHRLAGKKPAFGDWPVKEYNFSEVLIKGNNIRLTAYLAGLIEDCQRRFEQRSLRALNKCS